MIIDIVKDGIMFMIAVIFGFYLALLYLEEKIKKGKSKQFTVRKEQK